MSHERHGSTLGVRTRAARDQAQDSRELPKYFTFATEVGGGMAATGVSPSAQNVTHKSGRPRERRGPVARPAASGLGAAASDPLALPEGPRGCRSPAPGAQAQEVQLKKVRRVRPICKCDACSESPGGSSALPSSGASFACSTPFSALLCRGKRLPRSMSRFEACVSHGREMMCLKRVLVIWFPLALMRDKCTYMLIHLCPLGGVSFEFCTV